MHPWAQPCAKSTQSESVLYFYIRPQSPSRLTIPRVTVPLLSRVGVCQFCQLFGVDDWVVTSMPTAYQHCKLILKLQSVFKIWLFNTLQWRESKYVRTFRIPQCSSVSTAASWNSLLNLIEFIKIIWIIRTEIGEMDPLGNIAARKNKTSKYAENSLWLELNFCEVNLQFVSFAKFDCWYWVLGVSDGTPELWPHLLSALLPSSGLLMMHCGWMTGSLAMTPPTTTNYHRPLSPLSLLGQSISLKGFWHFIALPL